MVAALYSVFLPDQGSCYFLRLDLKEKQKIRSGRQSWLEKQKRKSVLSKVFTRVFMDIFVAIDGKNSFVI